MVNSSLHAISVRETSKPQLRTFSNEPNQIDGKSQTPVTSKDWQIPAATFTAVADDLKLLFGRDLLDQLGLAVTHKSSQKGNQINNI